MENSSSRNDEDVVLDIFGQSPSMRIYTQICFCFPVSQDVSHSSIIDTLTNGLKRLSRSFPWVAGQIVNEGASESNSGVFKIKALKEIPRLIVKDLRHDGALPSWDGMNSANFPINFLDETAIAPRKTLQAIDPDTKETPVFLLQANFIDGGLILTILADHKAMDGTGQGHIISLLSKACRGEDFTAEEVSTGNLDRSNIIPLLDESCKPDLAPAKQSKASAASDGQSTPPPNCCWNNFTFSFGALTELKSTATKSLASGFISTDDALSACLWQAFSRARLLHEKPSSESVFARVADVRSYLDIPQTYPGMAATRAFAVYPLQNIVDEPLGTIASYLRSALDPKILAHSVKAQATELTHSADKSKASGRERLNPSLDVNSSSWAKLDCYKLDFGLGLGKPEAVRRPRFAPIESLVYLLPRTLDGEITVALCLRDEDMERLKSDEEFAKYARCDG